MNASVSVRKSETYIAPDDNLAEIIDLVEVLESRGVKVPGPRPALVDGDGRQFELPQAVFNAMHQIVSAMSKGMGVTIAPYGAMLTTQESADFLGISRTTLVKLLESGAIPFEMRGRHRRVLLVDLVSYQQQSRLERAETLSSMVQLGEQDNIYAATLGPPPKR